MCLSATRDKKMNWNRNNQLGGGGGELYFVLVIFRWFYDMLLHVRYRYDGFQTVVVVGVSWHLPSLQWFIHGFRYQELKGEQKWNHTTNLWRQTSVLILYTESYVIGQIDFECFFGNINFEDHWTQKGYFWNLSVVCAVPYSLN